MGGWGGEVINIHHQMNTVDSCRTKVADIFKELASNRADFVCEDICNDKVIDKVKQALVSDMRMDEQNARDIGFHLSDWRSDAAFIVALHLFPERFTSDEIAEGVRAFVFNAPNHAAAAAALYGYPVEDVFGTFSPKPDDPTNACQ
jgi:hypothetical protein